MNAQEVTIRDGAFDDVPALLEIYNEVILHSTAIWTNEPRALEHHVTWFKERTTQHLCPVIVAMLADRLVGYASYGPFRAWPGYAHTVENSVYLAPSARGYGIAPRLLTELIERARRQQLHTMIAGIDGTNAASIRAHEKVGFVKAAHLREAGKKFGRWLDLLFYQRML